MLLTNLQLLVELGRQLCSIPLGASDVEQIVQGLATKSVNTADAVLTLIWNGMGADANILNRSILEAYLVGAYLALHPELCADFLQFHEVKLHRYYSWVKERDGSNVSAEVQQKLDVLDGAVTDWKSRKMPASSWSKVNLRTMAIAIDLNNPDVDNRFAVIQYENGYRILSSFAHSDVLAFSYGDDFGLYPTRGQFPGSASDLLSFLSATLLLLDQVKQLGKAGEVEAVVHEVLVNLPGFDPRRYGLA